MHVRVLSNARYVGARAGSFMVRWYGATEPGLGAGSRGTLSSLHDDQVEALTEATPIDRRRIVDDAALERDLKERRTGRIQS